MFADTQFERSRVQIDRSGGTVALLYKLDTAGPRLVHFAWHHDLRDDAPDAPYLWANIGLDDVNGRFLAA